ncbi:MAG: M28 family peptidase, partial [Bacteroidota bacterium]
INLDMVGAEKAYIPREGQYMTYAATVVDKVWGMARRLGHGNHFSMQRTDPIIDDHYYVSQIGGIKAIDIIDQPGGTGFFAEWHTHGDNMTSISRETLQAVGETLMGVIYTQQ